MKQKDRSYLWFVIPLLAFAVMMGVIGVSMAEGANAVDQVPKLIDRVTPSDSLFANADVLHAELFDSMIVVTMRVGDKIITDTIYGSGGDTTRILGTAFSDTLRVGGRAYFGWSGHSIYLDSARVDSIFSQIGRFAPGGAGSGDIEGVTAGNGLSGGGITGTVTLDVRPGWGIKIDNDSVEVNATQVMDSITGSGVDRDSQFVSHQSSRWRPLPDSTPQYMGETTASMQMDFSRADTILAFIGIFYGEGVVDSMLMSKRWTERAIGDSVAGKLDGINSQNGITGSASEGTATIEIDWPWLRNFIDTSTATIPRATLADTTNGGAIRAETSKTVVHAWIYNKIDTTNAKIPTASLADSSVKYDTANTLNWTEVRAEIKNGAEIYNKIDTTNAKIPTATLADSSVKYDTTNTLNWTEVRAEIKNGAEIWNKIDTTSAKIPTATLADSAVKYDTANVLNWTEVRTEIKNGAEIYNKIDTTSAKIPTASLADSASRVDTTASSNTGLAAMVGDRVKDTITTMLGRAETISGNWVNTANPWADNEVADNITVTGMGDLTDITAGNGLTGTSLTGPSPTINVVVGSNNGLTVNADSLYIDTTKILRSDEFRGNWLIPWPDSILTLGSGAGLTINSSVTLGTDITDSIRRAIQIPEYASVVYPRGYHATDIAAYDSSRMTIRAGHDATGSYVVCIDSLKMGDDHSRYAVLAFPAPDSVVRLNRILIQASSAENAVDSGVVWAGLKKNSVDSAGTKFQLEDLADRDSTSTSALDTLVLDNTGGLVPEAYTDGDVAYVVIRFTTRAGNGYSGVGTYYIRKAWAEWVRDKL